MWRNADVLGFIGWLRHFNDSSPSPCGFYGIDLYRMFTSIEAVIRYLDGVDPEAARRARQRYSSLDHFAEDSQAYGDATSFGVTDSCEQEVLAQLVELRRAIRGGRTRASSRTPSATTARCPAAARARGICATHMADTIDALVAHLGNDTKIVVWAHNSHLGDARATEMGQGGELNAGQLVRERHGDDARLIGFSTFTGTVTAADDWDGPAQRMRVRASSS